MSEETEHLELGVTLGGASFTGAGRAERVMDALDRFLGLVEQYGVAPPPPAPTGATIDEDAAAAAGAEVAATPPQESPASKLPLPKFLERDSIKENPEIATAIVVWAADHEQRESLTSGEIVSYWKGTKLKLPGNTSRDIGKAVKAGWLLREGRNLSATGYGREAIGLPA
jgi:hypothetical protein